MTAIELVIFDCDGVLMDSEIVAAKAELEIYGRYGIEMTPLEFSEKHAGENAATVKRRMEEALGRDLPDDLIAETKKAVNEICAAEAKMISGANEVLDRFDQPRCVCSNSPPERLEAMLSRSGLFDRFRPYVFSGQAFDPPVFKPQPDIFVHALEEFGCRPEQALVIEDSVPGILGAKSAGCRVLGFTGGSHSYSAHADHLIEAGAETVMRRLADLPAVIEAYGIWNADF